MELNAYIDHTLLKPDTLVSDIERLCAEAIENKFAAVCIPPPFVRQAAGLLKHSGVKTATVIGFPFGYTPVEAKLAESLLAIVDGAEELDMVINLAALKNNDWNYLANEINHILPIVHQKGKKLKIIIESGLLTENEIIRCCELYGAAGVDYLKTSTGFAAVNATVEVVRLMKKHLPIHVKIKASGGIRSNQFGVMLIEAGASRLGCSSSLQVINLDS
jgi:deoxyribose-phosphate aldolase